MVKPNVEASFEGAKLETKMPKLGRRECSLEDSKGQVEGISMVYKPKTLVPAATICRYFGGPSVSSTIKN